MVSELIQTYSLRLSKDGLENWLYVIPDHLINPTSTSRCAVVASGVSYLPLVAWSLATGQRSSSSIGGVASLSSLWASVLSLSYSSLWYVMSCLLQFVCLWWIWKSATYSKLAQDGAASTGFVVLFCLANFFANFGPNTTTFIIPGEAFPTRYRSTSHGISAASGKFGAILTQVIIYGLPKDPQHNWIRILLGIFAAFMATGFLSTLLIPETKGRTLEDMSNEDQKGFVQGPVTIPNYPHAERSPVISTGPYQHYPMTRL